MAAIIDDIIKGLGMGVQGAGQIAESRTNDVCGIKPAFWTKKDVRDKYNECMTKQADAKIEAIRANTAAAGEQKSADVPQKNKTAIVAGVSIGVIVLIIVIVLLVRRKKA